MVAVDPDYCHQCGRPVEYRTVHGRERAWCPDCERVFFRNAVPSVGVVIHDDGSVLLIERATTPDRGVWAFPGGHPEYDEEPVEAAARELREETGLRIDPDDLFLETVVHAERDGDPALHYDMITYSAERSWTEGSLDAGPEAADLRFWPVEEALASHGRTRAVDRRRLRMLFDA